MNHVVQTLPRWPMGLATAKSSKLRNFRTPTNRSSFPCAVRRVAHVADAGTPSMTLTLASVGTMLVKRKPVAEYMTAEVIFQLK